MSISSKHHLGIDLGGTKTAIGLVNAQGKIYSKASFPSGNLDFDSYYERLENSIENFLKEQGLNRSSLHSIGVGCAGQIELDTGLIYHAPNLNWTQAPLGKCLRNSFPEAIITVDNDVRAATLGEYLFGLKKNSTIYLNVFLGTGIGSGIIIHDRILRGASNSAGEIGLTSINFAGPKASCGNFGIYEYYASGTALERMAREEIQEEIRKTRVDDPDSFAFHFGSPEFIRGSEISKLAESGHSKSQELIKLVGEFVGYGLANVVNFLNPDTITYGGGLSDIGPLLIDSMKKSLTERALASAMAGMELRPASLGNEAGIIGSAWLHLVDPEGKIGSLS